MVRFKVIKASHLLLLISILVLLAAIIIIAMQGGTRNTREAKEAAVIVREVQYSGAEADEASAPISNINDAFLIEIEPDDHEEPADNESKDRILIYHTHTHEAYDQAPNEEYIALDAWRTADENFNVTRVGAALADELSKKGYIVIHDTTDHEQNDMDLSYVRSLETLKSYTEPFDIYIDLHRDAFVNGLLPCVVSNDGIEYAQLMCLVGRGDSFGENEKPDYETNLDFARLLTSELNRRVDNICRNITVKSGRYNQHIGGISLLIEAGHNKNTITQALNSIPLLAEAIDVVFQRRKLSSF